MRSNCAGEAAALPDAMAFKSALTVWINAAASPSVIAACAICAVESAKDEAAIKAVNTARRLGRSNIARPPFTVHKDPRRDPDMDQHRGQMRMPPPPRHSWF